MTGADSNRSRPPSRALREYVLKVHSRCDLACDHCYVYEHADQSWRTRPLMMTPETVRAAALRIAEHAGAHRLPWVRVILHGGEPLLLGPARLRATLDELRATITPVTRLDLRMQTNGVLLTPGLCDLLAAYPVRVGVSLDGDRAANDRHRRFATGRSSHDAVLRALALLRRPDYRELYAGILCTIDVRNDPVRVYEALLAEAPPRIDFLLPHATWDQPPYRPSGVTTPYADWLRRIFVRWLADGRPVPVRLFDSLLSAAAGGASGTEAVGLDPADLAVIETDGSWEQVDSLKTTYHGAAGTGLDVFTHPVDVVAAHPGIAARYGGRDNLCRTCAECPVVDRCGGGLFPHRYRDGYGFANPSVYCADLKEFITTMDEQTIWTTPAADGAPATDLVAGTAVVAGTDVAAGTAVVAGTDVAAGTAVVAGSAGTDGPVPADAGAPTEATVADQDATVLDQIGSGYGDEATINLLTESQYDITRSLLVAVRDATPASSPAARLAGAAWDLLGELDTEAPEAVAAVLTHPFVRAWAVRCLSAQGDGSAPADRPGGLAGESAGLPDGPSAPPDVTYFACLAAAAAIRAGVTVEVAVPVYGRQVHLPTLGRFHLPTPAGPTLTVTVDPGGVVLRDESGRVVLDGRGGAGWQPVRQVDRGGLSLLIEDADPYRDCFEWPVAAALSGPELSGWTRSVAGAWQAIGRDVPGQLPGVRGAQRVLVPLGPTPAGTQRAATARHAYGAVGVAPVADVDGLAVLLVHELQHAKLNAVLDLYDLVDPAYPHRLRVPWRPDPRPVEGVLHGTYAQLAIADIWRARAARETPAGGGTAAGHYRRYLDWTLAAIEALVATGALTPAGERFVDRMRRTALSWQSPGRGRR